MLIKLKQGLFVREGCAGTWPSIFLVWLVLCFSWFFIGLNAGLFYSQVLFYFYCLVLIYLHKDDKQ